MQAITIAIDLIAIGVLTLGIYFPRHRRRDLVVAFLGVNVGVLAVSMILGSTAIGAGLGLGLFGVLSIIRLRSREIEQHEVAYYFASLALGLIAGLSVNFDWLTFALMGLVMVVLYIGDHPRLFARYRQELVVLDRAIASEPALIAHLEQLLGAKVHGVKVEELDLVNDTTHVNVRYQLTSSTDAAPAATRRHDDLAVTR
ncbi:DUF4956 domain-containing protein [Leifsonia sp. Leaf264]|uniref:DUF4956 domain-containing protein n=1 Tax=Leifsonia sp. Leaf264 TaxID=1736314 RepID=UPI0006F7FCEA|nr:DUF4956 domain-containing protein [Leifsonia sp. Leaf264]KQO97728.1 permease [Leifsonia sp. Leaf264]